VEKVFDIIMAIGFWLLPMASFIRSYGTMKSNLYIKASGWASGHIKGLYDGEEDDNQLLYKCYYGLYLHRFIWEARFNMVANFILRKPKKPHVSILTDEEVKQLLKSMENDESH
jgi:hypothetical protein